MTPPPDTGEAAPDLGLVGDVESIDPDVIHLLVSRGFIPVIMPIGVGVDGTAYHINSDLFAGKLARTLQAEKLILMTNVAGVVRPRRQARLRPHRERCRGAVAEQGGPARHAAATDRRARGRVREGVQSVHIIDGGVPSALLLEVLTNSGVGTAVRGDADHTSSRTAGATSRPRSTNDVARPARRDMATSIDISEEAGVRYLHFGSRWIQGAMRMARPWSLELEYTRDMMMALLLRPAPHGRAACCRSGWAPRR